jgi:DNA-binding NarL/FixJ family response regulator/tRNA A-37 threonylcarbamoyl transferase component Bud32
MSSEPQISIVVVDDQVVLRVGLKVMLGRIPGVIVVGEAGDGQAAIDSVVQLRPAVVFMDVSMPKLDGIQATQAIKENYAETRIIMFTSNDNDDAFFAALAAGADGYCLKNATEKQLAGAINAVMQGAKWFDAGVAEKLLRVGRPDGSAGQKISFDGEQKQILELIEAGHAIEDIAKTLGKGITQVKMQLKEIVTRIQSTKALDRASKDALAELKTILETGPITKESDQSSRNWVGQCLSGKYMIEEIVGTGGMSVVYRARHTVIGKLVAIKMMHTNLLADTTALERMRNEARAISAISHPNIVAINDFDVTDDHQPYLVMDYVVGQTLQKVLDDYKKVQLKLCLQVSLDMCDALTALHAHNIVHRDLKPGNIILVDVKGVLVAMLLDFGIAKLVSTDKSAHRLTLTGEIFGSPQFMSPEHCLGDAVDNRSDLYSMGCIIYEMLCGESAFGDDVPYNVMWRQINEDPSRLPFLQEENLAPDRLVSVVFKLLNKQPNRRFQSAQELKDELVAILQTCQ